MTTLAPGHHLYPAADGAWRHAAPGDRFTRITGDNATLAQFRHYAHNGQLGSIAVEDSVAQLAALYAQRGLLDENAPAPARDVTVVVFGDHPVAATVSRLLAPAAGVVLVRQATVDEGAVIRADVVVAGADWLPDAHWQQVDAWCEQHETPWHRSYVEGTHCYLGPFTQPGSTASYRDLRGRRLAASGVADELLNLWAYLDDPEQPKPVVPAASVGATAVAAGLLCADVEGYLATGQPAWRNTQLGIDLTTGAVTEHPVLPLPATAP